MKLTSLVTLVFAVICLMMEYVLTYWLGYYEKWMSSTLWIVILRLLGVTIPFFVLLITWIISLFRKKHRLWTTAMLIGLLALIGLMFKLPPPQNMLAYSMRDRMMRDYSLDDLRRLARDVDQLPRSPDSRPGPTKIFMRDDLEKTGLKGKYPFLSLDKDKELGIEGPSYICEGDGVVAVRWGGTLVGHWGFTVSVNGGRVNPAESGTKILRVSDDIFFSVEK